MKMIREERTRMMQKFAASLGGLMLLVPTLAFAERPEIDCNTLPDEQMQEFYELSGLMASAAEEKNFEEAVTNIKINMATVINSNYWRIEGIKNQIDKAVAEDNYNLIITLVYTLVEGVLKGYLKENNVSFNRKDEITALAKLVKTHIHNNNSSKFVEKKALHQITTIADVINELRNQCSASHCDEKSDFVTAIFVRDLGYSLANVLINSLESTNNRCINE